MAEKKEIDSAKFELAFEKVKDALKMEFGLQDKSTLFADGLKELKLPEYVMDVVNEEKAKLFGLKPGNEFSKIKNYLDYLTGLPWEKATEEKKDLGWAEYILEKDLHGMKDVKKKILERIAVGMLEQQQRKGKILCFHGLPGVGKTTIVQSIAKAIGRKPETLRVITFLNFLKQKCLFRLNFTSKLFSRISAAEMADIKGRDRRDCGAMPGKLIQCLMEAQTENPLILIDDIDKINGHQIEEIASTLLQLIDPKQNSKFVDNFIEIPFNCSKIIFVCTANQYYTIPEHWQRRMEMIELEGYAAEEKMEIAKKYLIPKCQKNCDIMDGKLMVKDDALQMLLKAYCPQLGLNELEDYIGKICQAAAYKLAITSQQQIIVSSEQLMEMLDEPPLFCNDRLYEKNPVGVILGLATLVPIGGIAQYIEVSSSDRAPTEKPLIMTGHLSDIMEESIEIAFMMVKNFLFEIGVEYDFLNKVVHVHLPDGVIRNDGTSAGAAIASAIISLVLNQAAKEGFAMTGMITLKGKILPIGGVKEKVIAAKKAGAKHLILPEENKANFLKLENFIKEGIEVHFVTEFWQIFQLLFPNWKKGSNSPASSAGNGLPQSPTLPPSSDFMADLAKGDGEEGQKDCTDLAKVGEEVGKDGYEKPFSKINKDETITTGLKEVSADMILPAGEVIPTAGGGTAVQFMDVENLEQETPYDE